MNSTFKEYVASTVCEVKRLLKSPKALFKAILPSLIIAVIWTVLAFLEMAYPQDAVIRVFSFFTYAQGGIFGGFFGALGGIVGKALFAFLLCALVNALVNKRKISAKEIFAGFKINGLSALGCFLTGVGGAMLLYLVMNITSSAQNAMIGVAGTVMIVIAAGQKNGLFFMAVCGMAKLLSRGKAPSQITVSRVLSGMAAGFVIAVPLSLPRSAWICPIVCFVLLAAGVLLLIFGNGRRRSVVSAAMLVLMLIPLAASTVTAADTGDKVFPLDRPDLYTYTYTPSSDGDLTIDISKIDNYFDLQCTTINTNPNFGAAINGMESSGGSTTSYLRNIPITEIDETHI